METFEGVLDSLTEMDRYVGLMAAAPAGTAGVAAVVSAYLAGWPRERVLALQRIDAGWAPFDDRQQPVPVCEAADVLQIADALHRQCVALRESGIPATPELLELDLFFFFARQIVEERESAASRAGEVKLPLSRRRDGWQSAAPRVANADF